MIHPNILKEVIEDQLERFQKKETFGILRDIDFEKYLHTRQITVISGVRRSGKSTLLAQFSQKFVQYYYVNFEDERLYNFSVNEFRSLMIALKQLYSAKVVFLDEIQNVVGWERFVRRIHDEGYKVFITGSNARLLSGELATRLTGRYVKLELYSFSFKEFLWLKNISIGKFSSSAQAKIQNMFEVYLKDGGFPEYLNSGDKESLQRIYEDILYKDVLVRFKIKEVKAFKQLASFLFSNVSKELSYTSLKNTLGFKSTTSVKNYIEFMQESFLVFELYKYDVSLKKQFVSNKKIYTIDNGLRNAVAFSFSSDFGRLMENMVYIELRRRAREVYYYKGKRECDFIIKEKSKIVECIQVSQNMVEEKNEKRELEGLLEAMKVFHIKEGTIVTENTEDCIKKDGCVINVLPLWQWMLREH